MKVSAAVISLKRFVVKDKGLLWAFVAIFAGIISGSLLYALILHSGNNGIFQLFITFNIDFINKSELEIFSGITLNVLLYFMALFISGCCFNGKPLCVFITFIKMLGIGATVTYLYAQYELKGLEYVLLVFFPGKILLLFSSMLMTKSCFEMSSLVKNGISEKGSGASVIKLYYLKSLIYMLVFMLSAATDYIAIKIFSGLFDFDL